MVVRPSRRSPVVCSVGSSRTGVGRTEPAPVESGGVVSCGVRLVLLRETVGSSKCDADALHAAWVPPRLMLVLPIDPNRVHGVAGSNPAVPIV